MWLGSRQFAKYIIGFFMAIGKCFSVIVNSINLMRRIKLNGRLGLKQINTYRQKKIDIYAKSIESINYLRSFGNLSRFTPDF